MDSLRLPKRNDGDSNPDDPGRRIGRPAIIIPCVWDGHDNATRVQETGHGRHLDRYEWTDEDLLEAIETCLSDRAMRAKLEATSAHMQSRNGPEMAAGLLESLA